MNIALNTREGLLEAISYIEDEKRNSTNELEKLAFNCLKKTQEFNDIDLEYRVRIALIVIHNDLHKTDLVVSMFPWLLNTCDNNKGRYDYKQILWYYRWIITAAKHYSSIPKSKLFELTEDFERRCREVGIGEKTIHDCKFYFYSEMGELELAEKEYVLWQSTSYNIFHECEKCDKLFLNCYLADRGRYEELLEVIQPVLRGEITCHSNERYNFHLGMLGYMMLGKWEEAEFFAAKSMKQLNPNVAFLYPFSSHMVYYGITGQFEKGRKIFEKQFRYLLGALPDLPRLEFLVGALEFFKRLYKSNQQLIRLNLPKQEILVAGEEGYAVEEVLNYIQSEVDRLACALDQRNENNHYKQFVVSLAERYARVEAPKTDN